MESFYNLMKKMGFFLLGLSLVLTLSAALPGDACAKGKKKAQPKPRAARVVPAPSAPYADLIIEADTGRILRETNGSETRHPASLTKMMTLYLTFQAIENGTFRLDTSLPVSATAAGQAPSKLGLRAGGRIRVHDAILGLVTKSANDAAVVLAEAMGGSVSGFARQMNDQARTLGMSGTVFRNPSGLPDPQQITTARDMATLALALVSHFPGFYPYFGKESFVYNGQEHHNHNHLMQRYEGMDGIKTGYIQASGFNLVASAVRDGKRLIGVIFGGRKAASRDAQMAELLDEAFAQLTRETRGGPRMALAYLPLPSKVSGAFSSAEREPPAGLARPLRQTKPGESLAWGIQVGAFGDVLGARQILLSMMRSMRDVLGEAQPSLQKVTMTDGSTIYRARFVGLDEASAQSLCSYLVKRGQGCLIFSGS